MIEVNLQVYVNALFILMIASITTFLFVIRTLGSQQLQIPELKLFKLYFIAGMIGWIGLWLKDAAHLPVDLSASVVFYVLVSLFLILAIAKFRIKQREVLYIAIVHAITILASLAINSDETRILYIAIYTLISYPFVLYLGVKRARIENNVGFGIIAAAAALVLSIVPLQLYGLYVASDPSFAYGISLIGSSTGFVLVGIGFLSMVLINEHKQLTLLAIKDPLTSLLNRRGMANALEVSLANAQRNNLFISAIAIDIDYFKKINDKYGHDGGDYVLKEFSTSLAKLTRTGDVCCRLGGEEFVIVLPDTVSDSAMMIAERIRKRTENLELSYASQPIKFTASFGVATHQGKIDLDYLLKDADKALYRAKEQGRNRVVIIATKE